MLQIVNLIYFAINKVRYEQIVKLLAEPKTLRQEASEGNVNCSARHLLSIIITDKRQRDVDVISYLNE